MKGWPGDQTCDSQLIKRCRCQEENCPRATCPSMARLKLTTAAQDQRHTLNDILSKWHHINDCQIQVRIFGPNGIGALQLSNMSWSWNWFLWEFELKWRQQPAAVKQSWPVKCCMANFFYRVQPWPVQSVTVTLCSLILCVGGVNICSWQLYDCNLSNFLFQQNHINSNIVRSSFKRHGSIMELPLANVSDQFCQMMR